MLDVNQKKVSKRN